MRTPGVENQLSLDTDEAVSRPIATEFGNLPATDLGLLRTVSEKD
jgi:hypothetical protein